MVRIYSLEPVMFTSAWPPLVFQNCQAKKVPIWKPIVIIFIFFVCNSTCILTANPMLGNSCHFVTPIA